MSTKRTSKAKAAPVKRRKYVRRAVKKTAASVKPKARKATHKKLISNLAKAFDGLYKSIDALTSYIRKVK